jgi:hypothetical protein
MNGAQAMGWTTIIMSALSLGIAIYNLVKKAGKQALLRFIALAIAGLLFIQVYVLIYILSR